MDRFCVVCHFPIIAQQCEWVAPPCEHTDHYFQWCRLPLSPRGFIPPRGHSLGNNVAMKLAESSGDFDPQLAFWHLLKGWINCLCKASRYDCGFMTWWMHIFLDGSQCISLWLTKSTHKGRSSAICKWLCLFRVDCHRAELVNGLIEQI